MLLVCARVFLLSVFLVQGGFSLRLHLPRLLFMSMRPVNNNSNNMNPYQQNQGNNYQPQQGYSNYPPQQQSYQQQQQQQQQQFQQPPPMQRQQQQQQQMNSNPNARTFVSYNVYKGKAAMSVKPVNPVINTMSNGNKLLTKDGGLLIEIAPMSGVREYDWTKKSAFLLDPTECGQILYFHDSKLNDASFLHDTFMSDPSKKGQVTKTFKISQTEKADGYFFSLQVNSKLPAPAPQSSSVSIPVSFSEFYVIKNLIEFCLPKFLGFDQMAGNYPTSDRGIPAERMMDGNNNNYGYGSNVNYWTPPPPPPYKAIE